MKAMLLGIILYFLYLNGLNAFTLFEPSIECTVINVIAPQQVFGIKKFPELYQSINNDPVASRLRVGKAELFKSDPVSVVKTESFEKIIIKHGTDQLELELKGKPLSRNGTMTINGKLAAEVTCH
jgi:hypothetical protein